MATEFMQYSKAPFKRLSLAIVPINYELRLKPNLENFTFVGEEKIQLKVQESADEITLNSAQIEIFEDDTLELVGNGHKKIPLEKLEYNAASQTVTFRLKEPLEKDQPATLSFRFSGIINEKLSGFYRSKYMGPDGKVRWTAVTQFAPTDARRAFPCWDEPAIKATFDISLIVPKDDKIKALSNMAVSRESLTDDGFRMVKFTRTPVMSTYLVAFAIGEFDYCETRSGDGVLVRVYTPIGKSDQGKFAMDVCAKSLDFYKHYFQIAYPLNKMDLIAVSDFALGAMENWGLVTYREIRLLVDPANTSTLSRQNVALVVAHELAHQWFGNLVTMEWWTDLWLNEGFASFIEFLCVDHIFPEYNIWTQFVVDVYLRAMDLDGLQSSHPIEVPIGHPSEIDEIFDAISYSKGASIIRMLHKYIGDDAFRKGMNLYLTKHSYGNAQTDDLWLALEESSKKPIRKVMSSWTKQKGYPLVSISAFVDPASSSRFLTLSQEKFNLNGKMADEERQALWTVPVSIITSSTVKNKKSPVECLFEGRTLSLPLDKKELGPDDWFKLNPMTVGTYRVRYMPEQLEKFYGAISSGALPPLDRLGLLTDLLALVLSGKQTTVSLLRFMQAFRSERDYIVWSTLNDILARFDQLFANTDFHPKYCQFGRSLLNESIFPAIGWTPKPDEPYLDSLLRSAIITRLVGFEDESVLKECRRLFDEHVAGKSQIPADLRAAVYRGVAINADQETFDTFLRLMRQSDLQEEKNRISFALGWMKDEQLISRVLQLSLSEDIRSQDTIFVINTVASNPAGRDLAWKFFQQNKREFAQRYVGSILLSRFVKMITVNFCTEQDAVEIEQFFTDNCFPGVERSVQQATETIRLNAEVMARDSESVRSYLKSL